MNPTTSRSFFWLLAGLVLTISGATSARAAKELQEGELTVVKNQIDHTIGESKVPAKANEKLKEKSVIDTGANSFTEMSFVEGSVMRLGSNTRFTFESKERLIRLEEGALLIHTPPGNGGISVDGGGVVGAVSGSTVMASRDRGGNFSFLVFESSSSGRVTFGNGGNTEVKPGQIAFFVKAQLSVRVFEANLDSFIDFSPLFTQFPKPMPGIDKVQEVAANQAMEVVNEVKFIVGPQDLGIGVSDLANDLISLVFEKSRQQIIAAKNLLLTDLSTAAGQEIAKGEGDAGNLLLPPGSLADARQKGEGALAQKPSPGADRPGEDVDTAAGGPEDTETAAGDGGGTGTGGGTSAPVAPVGGGTAINPPSATPRGSTT